MRKLIATILTLMLLCHAIALAEVYTDSDTISKVQQALNDLGYDCGPADGIAGRRTTGAISQYQQDKGLDETGEIDDELLKSLKIQSEGTGDATKKADLVASMDLSSIKVTGDMDEPAFTNPEARYEIWMDKTDGSELLIYAMLDMNNDEKNDIQSSGALYISHHTNISARGIAYGNVEYSLQYSPYGRVLIADASFLLMKYYGCLIGNYQFWYDGVTVETTEGIGEGGPDGWFEYGHFTASGLRDLQGVRQDENGYTYFFIKVDDTTSMELVIGEAMRILQDRIYEVDKDGNMKLTSYNDYDVGPAWDIPQAVLDAMGKVLEPVGVQNEDL